MALALSSQDVVRFAALQEALLSPLEHESVDAWCAAVLGRLETLVQGNRSAFFLPLADRLHYVSESIEQRYLDGFQEQITEFAPGSLRYSDQHLDQAQKFRRQRKLEVWSIDMLNRMVGNPLKELPVYHEVVKPAGIAYSRVLTIGLPTGEALLGVAHPGPEHDPFGEEAGLELMAMLLPAFKAGVNTLVRLDIRRANLARTTDQLGEALAFFDLEGEELHRSLRLAELLADDPERERIVAEIRRLARSLASLRAPRSDPWRVIEVPPAFEELETATGCYQIRASYVGRGILGVEKVVLVALDRLTPDLPTRECLIDHFGLTPRRAEVALLLAQGLSNHEIAERLGISSTTVRHHAEWVFLRLGVHTRKALGLKLISDLRKSLR